MEKLDIVSKYGKMQDGTSRLTAASWNDIVEKILTSINGLIGGDVIESNISVNGVPATIVDGVVTLKAGQSYIISGTLVGQIVIDTTDFDTENGENTYIRLDNAIIINPKGQTAINYKVDGDSEGYKALVVTVTQNTINHVITSLDVEREDKQPGAIHSDSDLIIQGAGCLSLYNRGGHGARGKFVKIAGPHIYVEAIHDAIHATKTLYLEDGYVYCTQAYDVFDANELLIKFHPFSVAYDKSQTSSLYATSNDPEAPGRIFVDNDDFNLGFPTINQYYKDIAVSITESDTKEKDILIDATPIEVREGKYIASKPYVKVTGKIYGAIEFPQILTTPDCELILDNAYIKNVDSGVVPTVYFNQEKGKLKITTLKDSVNFLANAVDSNEGDTDVIKSENNIRIEMKSKSVLVIGGTNQDGIDGGEVKITDGKGDLILYNNGLRDIKGNAIVIGPDAEVTKSVIVRYYTDPTERDTEGKLIYCVFEGVVIAKSNINISLGAGESDPEYATKGTANIYARNGKYTKGQLGTTDEELKGVVLTNSIAAHNKINLHDATNFSYTTIVNSVYEDPICDLIDEGKPNKIGFEEYHPYTGEFNPSDGGQTEPEKPTEVVLPETITSGEYSASLESIVKTAQALNEGKNKHVKVTSKGNVEIEVNKIYVFTEYTGDDVDGIDITIPDFIEGKVYNSGDITEDIIIDATSIYEINGKNYTVTIIESPNLSIISGKNITLAADKSLKVKAPNYKQSSVNTEVAIGDNVEFDKSTTGVGAFLKLPRVKFDGPTQVGFNSTNISATGKLQDGGYLTAAGEFNMQHAPSFIVNGEVYVQIEDVYSNLVLDDNGKVTSATKLETFTPDASNSTKTAVYWKNSNPDSKVLEICKESATEEGVYYEPCLFAGKDGLLVNKKGVKTGESGAKVFLPDANENLWCLDTNSSGELKAPSKAYGDDGNLSTEGADHVIVGIASTEGFGAMMPKFYDGIGEEYKNSHYLPAAQSIIFPEDTKISPKREWAATVQTVAYADIVEFIAWAKTNKQGPWSE